MKRRSFIKATAAALGFPALIPASALGRAGRPAPSDRITLGIIGYGTQGRYNTSNFLQDDRVQAVAVCDCNRESSLYGYNSGEPGGRDHGTRAINAHYAKRQASHRITDARLLSTSVSCWKSPDSTP